MKRVPRAHTHTNLTVMYHYVRDRVPGTECGVVGVTPDEFKGQLDRLCSELEPIDWPAFHDHMRGNSRIPRHSFLLTFDDGLSDHYEVVAPILDSRGIKGVFFLDSECLTTGRLGHAHQVHALISALGREPFAQAVENWVPGHSGESEWLTEVERDSALRLYHYETPCLAVAKYLIAQKLSSERRKTMLADLVSRHIGDDRELARRWYLSHEQIRAMRAAGHTFGGHGHGHEPLGRLNKQTQIEQMTRCAAWLNDRLGPQPRPMSYPYGRFNDHTSDACRAAGFEAGFTTRPGWNTPGTELYRLHRVDTIAVDSFLVKESLCPA